MEWLALLIPLVFAVLLFFLYKHKTLWWEPLPAIFATLITIFIFKSCSESALTSDVEYHGGYITEAWYYEDWSEWIDQICSETYPCGSDSDGNTQYCTRIYDCSYRDYNPEYWTIVNNIGESWNISSSEYSRLVKKFSNQSFKDMNRPYCCRDDGDAYFTIFPGSDSLLESTTSKHTYKNKVKASNSIYKYKRITKAEADSIGLFDYPKLSGWKQNSLLGISDSIVEWKLNILNSRLGKEKQVRVYIIVTGGNSEFGELQEAYWEGGNKNEFNIILGMNGGVLNWSKIFTWSESTELKINIRNWIESKRGENIDISELVDFLYINIENGFVRKSFIDFDYLEVDMEDHQIAWLFLVTMVVSISTSVWVITNEFVEKNNKIG